MFFYSVINKIDKFFYFILCISFCYADVLSITTFNNETLIISREEDHINYGLSYPVTYEFHIPQDATDLYAYRKYQTYQDWNLIDIKTANDFFNGIEAVRFDYTENIAYVSTYFSSFSDSIFIQIVNSDNNRVDASFNKISKYYDNRKAAVTITGDDWADWNNDNFIQSCQNFRSFNLWYSVAVITNLYQSTWDDIQTQLDLGLIEIVSHSRTHPYVPYYDIESEVVGSKLDIVNNLNLLEHNRSGVNEYVYAWIAPYGQYSSQIDTMTSNANYLISRLFYWDDNYYTDWNADLYKFNPVGASIELGNSSYWGSYDINELNSTFQSVVDEEGIYHLTTHPNILQWNENFTWDHLEYISNRKDIWYVGFGHLYLYRFVSKELNDSILHAHDDFMQLPSAIKIYNNYPNPFNPATTLNYELSMDSKVRIRIYDMNGRLVKLLTSSSQKAGRHSVIWNSKNELNQQVSTGMYIYSIQTDNDIETSKMILLK